MASRVSDSCGHASIQDRYNLILYSPQIVSDVCLMLGGNIALLLGYWISFHLRSTEMN